MLAKGTLHERCIVNSLPSVSTLVLSQINSYVILINVEANPTKKRINFPNSNTLSPQQKEMIDITMAFLSREHRPHCKIITCDRGFLYKYFLKQLQIESFRYRFNSLPFFHLNCMWSHIFSKFKHVAKPILNSFYEHSHLAEKEDLVLAKDPPNQAWILM